MLQAFRGMNLPTGQKKVDSVWLAENPNQLRLTTRPWPWSDLKGKQSMRKLSRHQSALTLICLPVLAGIGLLTAAPAFAQFYQRGAGAAVLGVMMLVFVVFALAAYVYFALALQTIAKKTNTENAWWAWVPILNAILMLNIARKPVWWFILLLVPFVNIVIGIMVWMAIAEVRGKPNWWGILLIVPLVGLIVPGYLAWSD